MRHHQKIAIARLISDLIKSDDVICREEIALYNEIVDTFGISQDELYEAQCISLADSVGYISKMTVEEQKRIFSILKKAAYSDNSCVAKEALLLLTLKLTLNDHGGKYHLISSQISGWKNTEKYVMYIESDYMHTINEEIKQQYEAISNLLHLWKFEFIYIPNISEYCCELGREYLYDIIRYMNPRLSTEMLDNLYDRLTHITTESYTRDYLTNTCHASLFHDILPSLLINVGVSHVPCNVLQNDSCFVNFLTIRLENETNSVINEIRRFLDEYELYITEPEYHRPMRGKNMFKYHGFYKHLFDFLARQHTNGEENSILIDIPARRIWMRGIEIQMSGTQLATYVFILHQTFCTHYGGLVKAGQHNPLSHRDVERLGKVYHAICNLFRETPITEKRSYMDDVTNIRGYIARIRTAVSHHIDVQDVSYYYPKDSADKSMYQITIDPTKVRIKDSYGEYLFTDFNLWESIK